MRNLKSVICIWQEILQTSLPKCPLKTQKQACFLLLKKKNINPLLNEKCKIF